MRRRRDFSRSAAAIPGSEQRVNAGSNESLLTILCDWLQLIGTKYTATGERRRAMLMAVGTFKA